MLLHNIAINALHTKGGHNCCQHASPFAASCASQVTNSTSWSSECPMMAFNTLSNTVKV
jgi:hypothetical protein